MEDFSSLESMSLDELGYTLLVNGRTDLMVVDDEEVIRTVFEALLEGSGHHASFANTAEEALEIVGQQEFDLLVVDKNLPGLSGIELMKRVREMRPRTDFLVITGYASYESAVEALRLGALDYLEKPFDDVDLLKVKIDRAIERQKLVQENAVLADYLRSAHMKLESTVQGLDLDKQAVNGLSNGAAANDLRVRYDELKKSTAFASGMLVQANSHLQNLSSSDRISRGSLRNIQRLLAEAWRQLSKNLPVT